MCWGETLRMPHLWVLLLALLALTCSDGATQPAADECPAEFPEKQARLQRKDQSGKQLPGRQYHWAQSAVLERSQQAQAELVERLQGANHRLQQQVSELKEQVNATQLRLLDLEALFSDVQFGLQMLQGKILCNTRGEWVGGETGCLCHQGFPPYCENFSSSTHRFSFTGATQTFTVPTDGTTHLAVALWGAGGGASPYSDCEGEGCWGEGGAGGFSSGTVKVSAGQRLVVVVGEGGQGVRNMSKVAFGFGGAAYREGGGGAGLTGLFIERISQETALLVAGGGGGGGYQAQDAGISIAGGRGGGLVGGGGGIQQGGGGSLHMGGVAAMTAVTGLSDCESHELRCGKSGSALQGGDGSELSPGGGGGYFGGGAGLWFAKHGVGGGGGGSGYASEVVSEVALKGGGVGAVPKTPTGKLLYPVGDRKRVGYGGTQKGQAGENGYAIIITLSRNETLLSQGLLLSTTTSSPPLDMEM